MASGEPIQCPHCGQKHPAGTGYCPINGMPIDLSDTRPNIIEAIEKPFLKNPLVIAGIVVIGLIICLAAFVTMTILRDRSTQPGVTPTVLVILPSLAINTSIPAPTPQEIFITSTAQPEVTQSVTPTSGPWEACTGGDYLSRLRVGDTAEVSSNPPLANRVRDDANLNAKILGYIEPGEDALIIEGPRCSNDWVWWRVRSKESGLEGWTAEGDNKAYWLVPVVP